MADIAATGNSGSKPEEPISVQTYRAIIEFFLARDGLLFPSANVEVTRLPSRRLFNDFLE